MARYEEGTFERFREYFFYSSEANAINQFGLRFPQWEDPCLMRDCRLRSAALERRKMMINGGAEDIEILSRAFSRATRNPQPTAFPDYVFDNGFIELFKITSSKETKKGGSIQMMEDAKFKKEVASEEAAFKEGCDRNPGCAGSKSKEWKKIDKTEHSYDNLSISIHKNIEKHIGSLSKYSGSRELGVFFIEDLESNMNTFCVSNGILTKTWYWYALSKDRKALEYIHSFKEQIQYLVYHYVNGYEIIKVADIPNYLETLGEYEFHAVKMTMKAKAVTSVSLPFSLDDSD